MISQRGLIAVGCLILATVDASGADTHSATLSVQGDELGNRQWLGNLGWSLGEHAWVQGTVGRSDFAAAGAGDRQLAGATLGVSRQALSATVEFLQHTGDAQFKQQTWIGAFNWRGAHGGLGVDALARSTSVESTTTTQPSGPLASPVTTVMKESADGTGFGLHGDLELTPRTTVFAGIMRYRYDFELHSAATGASSPLSSLLGINAPLASVWRDQALIDRSYRIGGSYRLQRATLGAQYLRDRAARSGAALSTVQLQADVPIAEHWLISPTLGYSSGGESDATSYGGLSVKLIW